MHHPAHSKLFVILTIILVVATAALAYVNFSKSEKIALQDAKLNESAKKINELSGVIVDKDGQITSLSEKIDDLEASVNTLSTEIVQQEQTILTKTEEINEITELAKDRQEEIQRLKEVQKNLNQEGKLIVDEYGATLILYDTAEIYEAQSQYAELLKQDSVNYGSLGMPFIYFKDESKPTEDGLILGTYSSLYNYIFIYKENNNVRTLYHEIAHLVYFKYFIEVDNNLDIWLQVYDDLRQNNLLSTEYSYTGPEEGFAEEYSVYKTKTQQQPAVLNQLFAQVDGMID